jgi:hypothetical protein
MQRAILCPILLLFAISAVLILKMSLQEGSGLSLLEGGEKVEWSRVSGVRTPGESRISASDEQNAMETLVASGLTAPGGRLLPEKSLQVDEHLKAMQTLVNAGLITSDDISFKDLGKSSEGLSSETSDGRGSERAISPCDLQPDHLDCSEYPSGLYSPQYALAKLGPHIKVYHGTSPFADISARKTDAAF